MNSYSPNYLNHYLQLSIMALLPIGFIVCLVGWLGFHYGLVLGFFQDKVSQYNPDCPGTCSLDQAGLELRSACLCRSGIEGMHHHA